jgi:hypothetical protein
MSFDYGYSRDEFGCTEAGPDLHRWCPSDEQKNSRSQLHRQFMWLPSVIWSRHGWDGMLHDMCRAIDLKAQKLDISPNIISIKEKFGRLRVECGHDTPFDIRTIVDRYSEKSKHICDLCGDQASLWVCGGCWCTRCDKHVLPDAMTPEDFASRLTALKRQVLKK